MGNELEGRSHIERLFDENYRTCVSLRWWHWMHKKELTFILSNCDLHLLRSSDHFISSSRPIFHYLSISLRRVEPSLWLVQLASSDQRWPGFSSRCLRQDLGLPDQLKFFPRKLSGKDFWVSGIWGGSRIWLFLGENFSVQLLKVPQKIQSCRVTLN